VSSGDTERAGIVSSSLLPAEQPGGGRSVLIIDDETTLANNIAVYLERMGWSTEVAGTAEEGLALYAAARPDVVLLDHNLPGLSGLEALVRLRALDPKACVVMMTGFGSIDLAVAAMREGAVDYLTKPLALREVKLRLDRLMAHHRLERTVDYYRAREADGSRIDKLLGQSPAIVQLRERLALLIEAERNLTVGEAPTVLIRGETGSGKELVARALHYGGARSSRPFIELNCGALPQHLVEAELFGYEKGAFTDARQRKIGLVETAESGTLFLDEIGEADMGTQVKLLKLLEDRRYRRLGALREQVVNVRIVAATNRRLDQMVQEGVFRADLYFRLRIVQIEVPPLRERAPDIVFLARHFLEAHARRYGRKAPALSADAELLLRGHAWPGNVRELRNAMEQALLLNKGTTIGHRELAFLSAVDPTSAADQPGASVEDLNLERTERRLIIAAMERSGNNVSQAAKLLGVSRDTLRYRMERLDLR